jgi:cytochrome d ubiquinol oxidase subunit I
MLMPMTDLVFARAQMGLSLAFHIVFAAVGVALPLLMVVADVLHRRTGDGDYRELSRRLAKGTAVLFAVGAVSGTVLSFELGLLWPRFMGTFGPVIGLPFSLEGFAFFTEAIFLGIYLYGRDRISPRFHLFAGVVVALSGAASAGFVTLVNAFMNLPQGFTLGPDGTPVDVQPLVAMFSPAWRTQVPHVLLSCYQASAFAMAGIHAAVLLRHPGAPLHRKALRVALPVACTAALLQLVVGHASAQHVAEHQPVKLAALEGQFVTERAAPLRLGGWPDEEARETRWALEVPYALSLLAFDDPQAEVKGLDAVPREDWPPVARTHVSFQVMVGAGSLMALLAVLTAWQAWKVRGAGLPRWLLRAWLWSSPLGFVALEAGWLVTETGRQPWIVQGVMRTGEAVTPVTGLWVPFWVFTAVYLGLGLAVLVLLRAQVRATLPFALARKAEGAAEGEVAHAG